MGRFGRRVLLVVCGLPVICGSLMACGSGPPPTADRPTYPIPARTVRAGETPLALPPATQGLTQFTLIGLTSLNAIQGSHAEMTPKGRYVRIRLVVVNTDRSSVVIDTARQQLITADGVAHDPDTQAMLIRRQPDRFDLGSFDRLEFDLFYDVPRDARPTALRTHGGATLTDARNLDFTDIPLPK